MASTYSPCPDCRGLNRVPLLPPVGKAPVCGRCKVDLPLKDGINEVGASGLQALVEKSPLPVVVDFWAPWCGPCQQFAPTFQQAAKQLGGAIVFAKLNTEKHPLAGDQWRIRSIPTLALFRGGIEVDRISGALPFPELLRWLGQVR
jgi:thioredoxin 2